MFENFVQRNKNQSELRNKYFSVQLHVFRYFCWFWYKIAFHLQRRDFCTNYRTVRVRLHWGWICCEDQIVLKYKNIISIISVFSFTAVLTFTRHINRNSIVVLCYTRLIAEFSLYLLVVYQVWRLYNCFFFLMEFQN